MFQATKKLRSLLYFSFAVAGCFFCCGQAIAAPPAPVYLAKPVEIAGFPSSENKPAQNRAKAATAKQTEPQEALADSFKALARQYLTDSNTDSAKYFLHKALKIRKQTGPQLEVARLSGYLSTAELNRGMPDKALEQLMPLLPELEKAGEDQAVADVCVFISNVYDQLDRHELALQFLNRANSIYRELGLGHQTARIVMSIGNNYYQMDSFELAKKYYNQALALYKKNNDWKQAAGAMANLGNLELQIGPKKEGFKKLESALQIYRDINDRELEAAMLNNIGIGFWEDKDYPKAKKYFTEGLALATKTRQLEYQQDIAGNLYHMNKETGNLADALSYYEQYVSFHDTIFNETRSQQIAELQEKYEAEKRTQEIALLRKDKELKEANLLKVNWQRNASFAGTFLLAALAYLMVRNSRQKQKAALLLASKTEELNRQRVQELLREQELIAMHSMLKGQETERGRIAQDLHDRLGSLLATVKLHVQMANTPEQHRQVNKLIDDACQEVRQIAHNMVSGVLMKFGLVAALKDLANAISTSGKIAMESYAFGLDNRLPNHMEIELYRIVQELVSNALKHAQATEITVQINRQGSSVNLLVEDNGIGFNPQAATGKSGMGLSGIAARIKQLNGDLNIDSGKGSGTTIMADFPLPEVADFKTKTAPAGEFAYDQNSIS